MLRGLRSQDEARPSKDNCSDFCMHLLAYFGSHVMLCTPGRGDEFEKKTIMIVVGCFFRSSKMWSLLTLCCVRLGLLCSNLLHMHWLDCRGMEDVVVKVFRGVDEVASESISSPVTAVEAKDGLWDTNAA